MRSRDGEQSDTHSARKIIGVTRNEVPVHVRCRFREQQHVCPRDFCLVAERDVERGQYLGELVGLSPRELPNVRHMTSRLQDERGTRRVDVAIERPSLPDGVKFAVIR